MLINLMIFIPITEEFIFRGLILKRLLKKYNRTLAVIYSALIFSLFHINKNVTSAFIHGLLFALITLKFASLYYPIILHGIYNGCIFILQKQYGIMLVLLTHKVRDVQYWMPELFSLIIGLSLVIYYYIKHSRLVDEELIPQTSH